jgi:protein-histidine pros-kinase
MTKDRAKSDNAPPSAPQTAATLVHDLKNLLNPIALFAQVAQRGLERDRKAEALESIAEIRELVVQAARALDGASRTARRLDSSRSQDLIALLPDAVIAVDSAGVVTSANPRALSLFGYSSDELIGAKVELLLPESARVAHVQRRQDFEHAPRLRPMGNGLLLSARHKDGREVPVEIMLRPTDGGTIAVVRDVSERRAVDREVRRWREVFIRASTAIAISQGATLLDVNTAYAALHGYAREELVGKPLEQILAPCDRERVAAIFRGESGAHMTFEASHLRKDGGTFPAAIETTHIQGGEGGEITVAFVHDKSLQKELERTREDYLGFMSHDLRNPLSNVVLSARSLSRRLQAAGDAEGRHEADVILHSASSIDAMIREFLDVAYLESDRVELEREPTDLVDLVRSAIDRTLSTSVRPRVTLEECAPLVTSVDRFRIERVVVNFVTNAIKYSDGAVSVHVDTNGSEAAVSVSDNGRGIAPEDLPRVFEKFHRTRSAKAEREGFGLGLYICRRIAEQHGGRVSVESVVGRGSTFKLTLPFDATDTREAAPRGPRARTPAASAPAAASAKLAGKRVLLVEDEPDALASLGRLLRFEAIEVAEASDGLAALALVQSFRPHVVVLDLEMPGMGGAELLTRLSATQPDLATVIMTGFSEHDRRVLSLRDEHRSGFVAKPVDVDRLLSVLGTLIPSDE